MHLDLGCSGWQPGRLRGRAGSGAIGWGVSEGMKLTPTDKRFLKSIRIDPEDDRLADDLRADRRCRKCGGGEFQKVVAIRGGQKVLRDCCRDCQAVV